jgi:hypothetical protein
VLKYLRGAEQTDGHAVPAKMASLVATSLARGEGDARPAALLALASAVSGEYEKRPSSREVEGVVDGVAPVKLVPLPVPVVKPAPAPAVAWPSA